MPYTRPANVMKSADFYGKELREAAGIPANYIVFFAKNLGDNVAVWFVDPESIPEAEDAKTDGA